MQIPARLKVHRDDNNELHMKHVLRVALTDTLPAYITSRKKAVLSEGAGYKGNSKIGGMFEASVSLLVSESDLKNLQDQYPQWNISTREEAYYFNIFHQYGYNIAVDNKVRTQVNAINSLDKSEIDYG